MQNQYSAEEYKNLVEKINRGEAKAEEINAVKLMILNATKEIDSILKTNE